MAIRVVNTIIRCGSGTWWEDWLAAWAQRGGPRQHLCHAHQVVFVHTNFARWVQPPAKIPNSQYDPEEVSDTLTVRVFYYSLGGE